MNAIDVYSQYFHAAGEFNGIERKAAVVALTAESGEGRVSYTVSVNFFPFRDPEDFGITYDAFFSKEIYSAPGRRSKKREAAYLEEFRTYADELAASAGGTVYWDRPLRDARHE